MRGRRAALCWLKAGWLASFGVMVVMLLPANAFAKPVPVIGAYFAEGGVEPSTFSPNDIETMAGGWISNYVRGVVWSNWGGPQAEGVGQVSLLDGTEQTFDSEPAHVSPVQVSLGGLKTCLGIPVYTSYTLTLEPGAAAPTFWPKGSSGSFPCRGLDAPNEVPTRHYRGRVSGCSQGLERPHVYEPHGQPIAAPAPWTGNLPLQGVNVFCNSKIERRGPTSVTLNGIRENLLVDHRKERNWPAIITLSKPAWCPAVGGGTPFSYTELTMTVYGPPRIPNRRTLSDWSHKGLPVTGVGRQTVQITPACAEGIPDINPIPGSEDGVLEG